MAGESSTRPGQLAPRQPARQTEETHQATLSRKPSSKRLEIGRATSSSFLSFHFLSMAYGNGVPGMDSGAWLSGMGTDIDQGKRVQVQMTVGAEFLQLKKRRRE